MTEQQQIVWLTVLLTVFAGAQAFFTWWAGDIQRKAADAEADRRLKERNATEVERRRREERDWDVSRRLATTETMRISLLVTRFNQSEAPALSISVGLFVPGEFRVTDPGGFALNMARVGPEAGDLAPMVITMADDFANQVEALARLVQVVAPGNGMDRIRGLNSASQQITPIVLRLKAAGEELKALIDDASQQCLPEHPGTRRFRGTPQSGIARAYKSSWERNQELTPAKGTRGE